jgi:hypothetical protein
LELESEAIHTHFTDTNDTTVHANEWGTYLQGAYAIRENWHLVGRYEYFVDRGALAASKNALLGVAYKSAYHSVWKIEYVEQYGELLDIQSGLYASLAILF